MNSLLIAALCFIGYIVAYHTYGRFLARKIFKVDTNVVCPSTALRDEKDYVPTPKGVVFGHHFTSIAGLGPVVGPAIAIIWGWLPALLWVFFGSIFMGAVADFGALVASLRNQGRSVGDIAAGLINKRVRTLFLIIIFFVVWIVIAVFALIIGILFNMYPTSVLPIWLEIPIAVLLGWLIYRKGQSHRSWGMIAVVLMYATVVLGAYYPVKMPSVLGLNPIIVWVLILFVYSYIASALPVTTLLQPRDYINSHQLFVAIGLLLAGTILTHPQFVAPAVNPGPEGAPPMLPFLFIIIACGAISGFHSLVSSGTSAKQCAGERDSLFIGYGSMLTEAALSTLAIVAVGAGIGLGLATAGGEVLTGPAAFTTHYASWSSANGLGAKLNAFVGGSANLIVSLGIPKDIALAIMGVFIVSFAATTLDSATRIQRYVVSELAQAYGVRFLAKPHPATMVAVCTSAALAFHNGLGLAEVKKGALVLWPLFGTANQLLAALALLVVTVYLARRRSPAFVTFVPMVFMVGMTGWAMLSLLRQFHGASNWFLFSVGVVILVLEAWMIIESLIVLKKVYATPLMERVTEQPSEQ